MRAAQSSVPTLLDVGCLVSPSIAAASPSFAARLRYVSLARKVRSLCLPRLAICPWSESLS